MLSKKLDVPITGIDCKVKRNVLILQSRPLLKVLSSAVLNGGMRKARTIINYQTSKRHEASEPESLLQDVVRNLSLPKPVVGMMTAADVEKAVAVSKSSQGLTLSTIVTAGTSNLAAAGDTINSENLVGGTINMVIVVDGNLTESCLVNSVMTATEAKAVTLRNLDLRSPFSGEVASGTTSDAIAVACTGRGARVKYAGTATVLGWLLGKSVREALAEAIRRQEELVT